MVYFGHLHFLLAYSRILEFAYSRITLPAEPPSLSPAPTCSSDRISLCWWFEKIPIHNGSGWDPTISKRKVWNEPCYCCVRWTCSLSWSISLKPNVDSGINCNKTKPQRRSRWAWFESGIFGRGLTLWISLRVMPVQHVATHISFRFTSPVCGQSQACVQETFLLLQHPSYHDRTFTLLPFKILFFLDFLIKGLIWEMILNSFQHRLTCMRAWQTPAPPPLEFPFQAMMPQTIRPLFSSKKLNKNVWEKSKLENWVPHTWPCLNKNTHQNKSCTIRHI